MKQPEYSGNGWAIHNSDCVEGMAAMPENSVDCAIFSPPFGDLFVYSDSERDIGNSGEGDEFFKHYKFFAQALTRVIKPGRIVCVHCTDIPMRKGKHGNIGLQDFSGDLIKAHSDAGMIYHGRTTIWKDPVVEMQRTKALGLLYKTIRKNSAMNRVGMPDYMLFFRKDGDIENPIEHTYPDDEAGALRIARETLSSLQRQGLIKMMPNDDLIETLTEYAKFDVYDWQKLASPVWMDIKQGNVLNRVKFDGDERHVCPLQLDTIQKCLRLYTAAGDVVLDPFNGIGSTGYESVRLSRKYLGFELKPEYAEIASKNLIAAETLVGSSFDF